MTGVFWPNAGKCQNSQTSGLLDELKSKLHARVCRLTCSPSILDDRQLTCSPLQRKIRKFLIFGFSNKVTKSCTLTRVRRRSFILLRASEFVPAIVKNVKLGHENSELFGTAICETSALHQSKVLGYLWTSSLDYNYVSQKQLSTQNVLVSG